MNYSHLGRAVVLLLIPFRVDSASGQSSGPLPDPTIPVRIELCEVAKVGILKYHNCGILTWNGQNYDATFQPLIGPGETPIDAGGIGTMTFLRVGNDVTLSRIDSVGTEGSGTYRGTITGNTASGTATWFHPHWPQFKGTWTATFIMAAPVPQIPVTAGQPIGEQIEICEEPMPNVFNLHNCGTLCLFGRAA
jgi:hypothetical protein